MDVINILDWFNNLWNTFAHEFDFVFIQGDRYKQMLDGIFNTLKITAGSLVIGILIGIVVAAIRSSYDKSGARHGFGFAILKVLNAICKVYLTIIRGTPVVVQLMICYFLIFISARDGVPVAIFAFGINSGAYVAEIIRGGLMSLDPGQAEAGRSLGLNYLDTMRFIVVPQAFKAILPSLGNEFITLLKDTALIYTIGGEELVYAARAISTRTYEQMFPLVGTAVIYLILVMIFTWLQDLLERRLRQSDRR